MSDRRALNQRDGEGSGNQSKPSVRESTAKEVLRRAPSSPTLAAAHAYKSSAALRAVPSLASPPVTHVAGPAPARSGRMRQGAGPGRAGPRAARPSGDVLRGCRGQRLRRGLRPGRGSAPPPRGLPPCPPRCQPVATPPAPARHLRAPQPPATARLPPQEEKPERESSASVAQPAEPLPSALISPARQSFALGVRNHVLELTKTRLNKWFLILLQKT